MAGTLMHKRTIRYTHVAKDLTYADFVKNGGIATLKDALKVDATLRADLKDALKADAGFKDVVKDALKDDDEFVESTKGFNFDTDTGVLQVETGGGYVRIDFQTAKYSVCTQEICMMPVAFGKANLT